MVLKINCFGGVSWMFFGPYELICKAIQVSGLSLGWVCHKLPYIFNGRTKAWVPRPIRTRVLYPGALSAKPFTKPNQVTFLSHASFSRAGTGHLLWASEPPRAATASSYKSAQRNKL